MKQTIEKHKSMRTKSILIMAMLLTVILHVNGQDYKKNLRSPEEKLDKYDSYQIDRINKVHLIKALELAGIRIFNFPLKPFDKKYKMHIYIHEYIDGAEVKEAENIYFAHDNTYTYFEKNENHPEIRYIDYIESITFYTKETDTISSIAFETYAMQLKMPLKQKKTRESQFYKWRSYSQTDWILNEEVPLLVYASSWYDEKQDIERFCGAADLSLNEEDTKELLGSSLHYFVISYKIFE
jgi:hypothetical protein